METKEENIIIVRSERSYINCLTMGIGTGFKHIGQILMYMWPSMLVTALLPFPGILFFLGQLNAVMRKWIELGYVPKLSLAGLKPDILRSAKRGGVSLAYVLVLILLVAISFFVSLLSGHYFIIAFGCACVVLFLLNVLMEPVLFNISFSDKSPKDCSKGVRVALRNYGSCFSFSLLSLLFVGIVSFVGFVPLLVTVFVLFQAFSSLSMGDTLDLPDMFLVLVFLAYLIGAFVCMSVSIQTAFCRCLMWGSLVEEIPADSEVDGEGI